MKKLLVALLAAISLMVYAPAETDAEYVHIHTTSKGWDVYAENEQYGRRSDGKAWVNICAINKATGGEKYWTMVLWQTVRGPVYSLGGRSYHCQPGTWQWKAFRFMVKRNMIDE